MVFRFSDHHQTVEVAGSNPAPPFIKRPFLPDFVPADTVAGVATAIRQFPVNTTKHLTGAHWKIKSQAHVRLVAESLGSLQKRLPNCG
jgi:hypothetical protein